VQLLVTTSRASTNYHKTDYHHHCCLLHVTAAPFADIYRGMAEIGTKGFGALPKYCTLLMGVFFIAGEQLTTGRLCESSLVTQCCVTASLLLWAAVRL
jgi:hypothetical protein